MNNIAKFNATEAAIKKVKGQSRALQEEVDKIFDEKQKSPKEYLKALLEVASINCLSIDRKKGIITFNADGLYYAQPIWRKRRRINAVPACLLIQLYKEKLKEIKFKEEQEDVPFELKGFWKMDRAIEFLDDVSIMQRLWTRNIQKLMNYNYKNKEKVKESLEELLRISEELEVLSPQNGCVEVKIGEKRVIVKMKNTKLDVVPLCKLFTSYYVSIKTAVYTCLEKVEKDDKGVVEREMAKILENFEYLIKKYFMLPMIIKRI